jgi:hypothetical protein
MEFSWSVIVPKAGGLSSPTAQPGVNLSVVGHPMFQPGHHCLGPAAVCGGSRMSGLHQANSDVPEGVKHSVDESVADLATVCFGEGQELRLIKTQLMQLSGCGQGGRLKTVLKQQDKNAFD